MNGNQPSRTKHGVLTRRVLAWMLLLSVAPLLFMGWQGYHCGQQAIIEKTQDHLHSIMNSRAALVSTWFDQRYSELDVIASSPSVARCCAHFADLSEEEIDREVTAMLSSVVRRVNTYDEIAVMAKDGSVVADVTVDGVRTSLQGGDPFVQAVRQSDTFVVGSPELNESGSVTMRVGRRIQQGGAHAGVIIATLNLTRGLDPLLQSRAGMGETGKVYLMWGDDTPAIMTEPFARGERVALRVSPPQFLFTHGKHVPDEHLEYTDYRKKEVWARAARIYPFNFVLVVEQDRSEALAWLHRLIYRVTVTAALTTLVLVAVAFWISRRLGEPLRVLAHVAQRVRGGATDERVGPLHGSEAEEVRKAFNQMLDELRDKQRELLRTATLATVGELSSSIVHEMRNPLSSIKMNLQALKREVENDPSNRELAGIADAQVRRLERMLDDLLQYGRPIDVRPEPSSFTALVESVKSVVGDQARSKNVAVEVHDELMKSQLAVDQEQMCRALTNVVANAIQAAPPGGKVIIRARKEGLWSDVGYVEVADNGPGLSSEALERVFTPFFTTKEGGTGLGLANVKKIVELHGGTVSAANRTEGGAIISMRLPLVRGADAA